MGEHEIICSQYEAIKNRIPFNPTIGIVLGSGLGEFVKSFASAGVLYYNEIKDMPISTAPGHEGRYYFCKIANQNVVFMQGRVHYYEGYTVNETVRPIRLMAKMGVKTLFLTNSTGGVNPNYEVGDVVLIKDHIASLVPSPLVGSDVVNFGVQFLDVNNIYDRNLRDIVKNVAQKENIKLQEGVFIQTSGTAYETAAEVRAYRTWGADCVAMSLAIEALAAYHMGVKICGLSSITNMATGMSQVEFNDQVVNTNAAQIVTKLQRLIEGAINEIANN